MKAILQKLAEKIFYVFLLFSPLTVRKIIYSFKIDSGFNEYTSTYIYLSDIAIILLFFVFILYNNNYLLSIINSSFRKSISLFHVEQYSIKKTCSQIIHNYLIFFPLLLGFFSLISILWTTNGIIGTYRSLKLIEFIFLYYIIVYLVPRGTILKKSLYIISAWGIFQSIIGILQFLKQSSLGLFFLRESIISPNIPGVAKIIFQNHQVIRAYGLFPHPNIFGGFLVISIITTFFLKKFICSTWNKTENTPVNKPFLRILFHVEQNRNIYFNLALSIQIFALLLTFSKSAIIGFFIALLFIAVKTSSFVPRGTTLKESFFSFFTSTKNKDILSKSSVVLGLFVFSELFFNINKYSLFFKSLQERLFYLNVSRETFFQHPYLGIGIGQFVFELLGKQNIEIWQIQPVHNVFLLIINEMGIFMFTLFAYFIFKLFHVEQKGNKLSKNNSESLTFFDFYFLIYYKAVLLAYLFIMIFDHYLWDIQQGQILFWMLCAFLAAKSLRD